MNSSSLKPGLRSLDDALAELLGFAQTLRSPALWERETVSTLQADARVLAQDVLCSLNVPAFDNSAMDGYALRCADVPHAGVVLPVSQRITAGAAPTHALAAGTVARIFTGAPLPHGADAVVMQEHCELIPATTPHAEASVRILQTPNEGGNVRRAGQDVQQGSVVLRAGRRLSPADLGLAASVGEAHLVVARRARVALFSTGDELVMPGDVAPEQLPPGAIYNSNRFFLRALLQRCGCDVTDLGILPDSFAATQAALREAALTHDVVVSSGGVSVGEEDHVKPAVESLGQLHLWQLAIKPGKPFAYGQVQQAHFIGLPGNPVSSWVTFLLLARPFLLRLQGVHKVQPRALHLPADFAWTHADKRREFLRAQLTEQGRVQIFPNQSSGVLTSVSWADGLVDLAPGRTVSAGDTVPFIPFSEWLS